MERLKNLKCFESVVYTDKAIILKCCFHTYAPFQKKVENKSYLWIFSLPITATKKEINQAKDKLYKYSKNELVRRNF